MMRYLLICAVTIGVGAAAQAGPLGILSPRGTGPVRRVVQVIREHRPVATVAAQTVGGVRSLVESRPVATFVGNCANGICPK
jgi:hypothetical protein